MARRIVVNLINQEKPEEFNHRGRDGGSYTIKLELNGSFATIVDEWDNQVIYPSAQIKSIYLYERN